MNDKANGKEVDTLTCKTCGGLYHGIIACPMEINWEKLL